MNTLLYLIRRIAAAIPILILVGLITFLLIHLTPGDPAAVVAGENASLEAIEATELTAFAVVLETRQSSVSGNAPVISNDTSVSATTFGEPTLTRWRVPPSPPESSTIDPGFIVQ